MNPGQRGQNGGFSSFQRTVSAMEGGNHFSIQLLLVSLRSWQVVPGFTMFIPVLPLFWPFGGKIWYKTSSLYWQQRATAKIRWFPGVGCKIGLLRVDTGNHLSSVPGLGGVVVGKSLFIIKIKASYSIN